MIIEKQLSENELFLSCFCASQGLTALQLVTSLIKLFSECLKSLSALLSPGISGWALSWLVPQKHNYSHFFTRFTAGRAQPARFGCKVYRERKHSLPVPKVQLQLEEC